MFGPHSLLQDAEWVVVTGAGKGIGKAIALAFAKLKHFKLLLISKTEESLVQTANECRELGALEVLSYSIDLSLPEVRFPEHLRELNVALVINNAGLFSMVSASDMSPENALTSWNTNVLAAIHCNEFFLPSLQKKGRGGLFHIISAAANAGRSYAATYASAKHALAGYVKSLREDLKSQHIAVSAINPGQTFTNSWAGSDVDPKDLIQPNDIALLVVTMAALSTQSVVEQLNIEPIKGDRAPM
jgi:short-subunit dehydrogenase